VPARATPRFRDPRAPRDAAALGSAPRARRCARVVGGPEGVACRRLAKTTWRWRSRIIRSSTWTSRRRSRRASTARARSSIWDRGTYECLKWEPRKVEVALHGERVDARYALFPIDKDEEPKNWLIHRMDPPPIPTASRCQRASCRCSRAPERCRCRTAAGRIEIKWDGVRAIAYSQPGELRLESRNLNDITDTYPELFRGRRARLAHSECSTARSWPSTPTGARASRRSRGACTRRLELAGDAAGQGHARDVRDLRPAVAGRPLADGAALQRATRASGRAAG
jgi:hypothetical protein